MKDYTGLRFNRWTVLRHSHRYNWVARCDCGTERVIYIHNLIRGQSVSCGCHQRTIEHNRIIERHAAEFQARNPKIPLGLCQCGCGRRTSLAKFTRPGTVICRGMPRLFILGHRPLQYPIGLDLSEITPEFAYAIGFILADGNIRTIAGQRGVTTTITNTDRDILTKLRRVFLTDAPIGEMKRLPPRVNCYRLVICDRRLGERLMSLGMTPRKSLTATLPDVPRAVASHLIRGYFDGDGCAYVGSRTGLAIGFVSGSKLLLEQVADLIAELLPVGLRPVYYDKSRPHAWRLKFSWRDSLKISEWMYRDAGELFMPRKLRKFQSFAEMKGLPFAVPT